ncbi:MAG TPA: lysophospholipid acyltransferase family protein [Candidatus Limnocylindria bacterium]|nr:lysophospholipid acyltransferase family protein [Candidatus Limnocylindria bacterium]
MQRILHGTGYWLWRVAAVLVRTLPVRVAYAGAVVSGELAYLVWARRRRITKENFAVVLQRPVDHPEVARVARRTFRNFAKYITEIMRFPALGLEDLVKVVRIDGWEHLRAALAHRRGIIFVSIHLGNFEVGGARIAEDVPLNVVADELRNQRLMDLLVGNRAHKNITIHPPGGAAKKVLGALRRNEMVGLMMDLGPRASAFENMEIPFFGAKARFPTVAASLARASGAPIVVAAVVRERDNTFRGIALPPIVVERTREGAQDVERATHAIVRQLEEFIRRWPDQWYIFRPMWSSST